MRVSTDIKILRDQGARDSDRESELIRLEQSGFVDGGLYIAMERGGDFSHIHLDRDAIHTIMDWCYNELLEEE